MADTLGKEDMRTLCRYNPNMPILYYSISSVRADQPAPKTPAKQISDFMERLKEWSSKKYIAIDGMNGTGKSTFCQMTNRAVTKINLRNPSVTKDNRYNFEPEYSMTYLLKNVLFFEEIQKCSDVYIISDRCSISNIIYLVAQQLMAAYGDTDIPRAENDPHVLGIINNVMLSTGLIKTLSAVKHTLDGVFFVVSSNLEFITAQMINRGEPLDIIYSSKYNYQLSQVHAFKYFANMLDIPILDLDAILSIGLSIKSIYNNILFAINAPKVTSMPQHLMLQENAYDINYLTACNADNEFMLLNSKK